MIYSDADLLALISSGELDIDPHPIIDAIQPSSIDLRLSQYFRVFNSSKYTHIDPRTLPDDLTELVDVGARPFILHPGEFVLGSTVEKVTIGSTIAARIEGKSSNGRIGTQVHSTAGVIDPGFCGNITLELSNVASLPIELWPDMWIGQLTVFMMTSPARRPYGTPELGSKYQHQAGPTAPRTIACD